MLILRENPAETQDFTPFGDKGRPSASIMTVPVREGGAVIGTLSIQSYRPRAYTRADLDALQDLTDHCAGALERLRGRDALHASELRFRTIVESEPECVKIISPEGRLLEMNAAGLAMLECATLKEAQETDVTEWIGEKDRQGFIDLHRRVMHGGRGHLEFELFGRSGTRRWVETHAAPLRDASGRVTALLGVTRDMTERKRAEVARDHTLSLMRATLESTADGILVVNGEGRIETFNRVFAAMWRVPGDVLATRDDARVLQGVLDQLDEPQKFLEKMTNLYAHPEEESFDTLEFKDGRVFERYSQAQLLEGQVAGRVWSFRDITERRRAEAEMQQSFSTLQLFIDTVPSFIAFVDAEERYQLVNRRYEQWFSLPQEKIIGRKLAELHRAETYAGMAPRIREVKEGRPVRFDSAMTGRDGKQYWFDIRYVARRAPDGAWLGHFVLALDVTDRRRAEIEKEAMLALETRLSAATTPAEAAQAIFDAADGLWKWDAGALDVYSPAEDWVWSVKYLDVVDGERREVRPGRPTGEPTERMRRLMKNGAELILRQPPYVPAPGAVVFGDTGRLSASLMGVPIRAQGQPVGVLSIQSYTQNAFTEADLKLLQGLADHCGGALERLRATEALRESEERYRRLFDLAPVGILREDETGKILDVNAALCLLTGYTREELIGQQVSLFVRPELAHVPGEHIRDILGGGVHRHEVDNLTKTGEVRRVELTETRITTSDGRREILSACTDFTERRRAEEALRRSEFLLRCVLDTNPAIIVVKDRDSRILLANEALAGFYGLRVEDVIGRRHSDLHAEHGGQPAELAQWLADDRHVIATGERIEREESGTDRQGELHHFHTFKYPLELDSGLDAVLVITEEITQRKRAEEALRDSRDQLRRLARRLQTVREEERTSIAREIHDVLAQELTRLKLDLSWIDRRLAHAANESTRADLKHKVASMMELADVTIASTQQLATELRPVVLDSLGLGPAIEWQVEDFQNRTGLTCVARVSRELPPLDRAQATALFRIVQESLTNVVRHAGARRVEVKIELRGAELCLSVLDDGRGITRDELADPKSIGLLGMKERAALLGGEAEITPAPGGGTLVRVTTPLPAPENEERNP
jgi:PAS domain S-box-containing protein